VEQEVVFTCKTGKKRWEEKTSVPGNIEALCRKEKQSAKGAGKQHGRSGVMPKKNHPYPQRGVGNFQSLIPHPLKGEGGEGTSPLGGIPVKNLGAWSSPA